MPGISRTLRGDAWRKVRTVLSNGTIALVAALQAAGMAFGDEVIVPAYTWDGTATAVLFRGRRAGVCRCRSGHLLPECRCVREAITPRTRAILPVHLAMRFTDMDGSAAAGAKSMI